VPCPGSAFPGFDHGTFYVYAGITAVERFGQWEVAMAGGLGQTHGVPFGASCVGNGYGPRPESFVQRTFCLESMATGGAPSVYFRGGGDWINVLLSVGGCTFSINPAL
jgi:hypothetical protein